MRNKKSAFSLIEISIVILIIGILVAGVTQSSRLISNSRVTTAQTLTQSAPVTANKGLMLWLETSSEASFAAAESSDNAAVTVWNDINTQSISKLFARTITASSVVYKAASPLSGLPSLYFSSTNTGMTLSSTSGSTTATTLQTMGSSGGATNFTFFAVYREETNAAHAVFFNGVSGTSGWGFLNNGSSVRNIKTAAVSHTAGTTNYSTNATISSGSFDGTTIKLYTNGNNLETLSSTAGPVTSPTTSMLIGTDGTNHWLGYISEIIVFDNALKDDDRKAIEQYLGKKYSIKITN